MITVINQTVNKIEVVDGNSSIFTQAVTIAVVNETNNVLHTASNISKIIDVGKMGPPGEVENLIPFIVALGGI